MLSWRHEEATLFMLQQVAEEFENESRTADLTVVRSCVEYTASMLDNGE
jgi:hypothetical protein